MEILGRMVNASNSTLVVLDEDVQYIYKPISGERPLWDFPEGTLALRERAAFVLSELGNWNVVPETVLREGPLGLGSFQQWVEADVTDVDVVSPHLIPSGWKEIVRGVDESGGEVALVHADSKQLRAIALFDAVANNADRKGGHLLTTGDGHVFAIDHGVTFHEEPKLRTVLWGYVGEKFTPDEIQQLQDLHNVVSTSELTELINGAEMTALEARISDLLSNGHFPAPSPNWPSVPWPVF